MNLDDVIQILESRPGMITINRSLFEAELFINGFLFSRACDEILDKNEVRFQDEFSNWIRDKYDCNIQSSWGRIIMFYEGGEEVALKKFLKMYREFFGVI